MKKLLAIISIVVLLCLSFALTALADENTAQEAAAQQTSEEKQSNGSDIDNMKEMEFEIDGESFLESLGYMGKGMFGIFVVTLVIIGAVAILNWHGRSLERRNQNKKD